MCAALKGGQWVSLSYLANVLLLDSLPQAQQLCEAYGLSVGSMPDSGTPGVLLDKVRYRGPRLEITRKVKQPGGLCAPWL